ncbi:FAD dependent oxidoreductase [Guyanagaster necrorhizus]|uniref:FAD dependent oxidoreductase n=1 Tax=Guyanagaster necrorhizus TaxID=856835 RepID=A0A9P8AMF3_9AGAR|nr:FAD dependent oxidoreductase [Guyanagaster necrorhizus MCA 3950]KAG7440840.1 FAD dependent oxidoreductase [Guyanagaster necrorhizus MCA 3950]
MTSTDTPPRRSIVIIGAGIIGCSTAYYLSRHPSFSPSTTVRVIEASINGPAQGASGKAGGLVAQWAYPKELVDVSFAEHVKLAKKHNGKERWGWRYVETGSWEGRALLGEGSGSGVGKGGKRKSLEKTLGLNPDISEWDRKSKGLPDDLLWVRDSLTDSYSPMAATGETAQVHPYQFTTSMLDLAKEKGVEFVSGKVTSIKQLDGQVTGVVYTKLGTQEQVEIHASDIILCAGAWSPSLVPGLPITGTRAHSITIRATPGTIITPYALFTEITLQQAGKNVKRVTPELYARPDNEVYACGPGDDSALPETVDDVQVDEAACESIRKHVSFISKELSEGTVDKRQACFLPIVKYNSDPLVGAATKIANGLFIAAGHTCWGICNAPGTAKAISQLVMDGKIRCGNLKKLDPSRFS